MIQTDQYSGGTGTGDGRQVAGSLALETLPLVILEVIVLCLLVVHRSLKV